MYPNENFPLSKRTQKQTIQGIKPCAIEGGQSWRESKGEMKLLINVRF